MHKKMRDTLDGIVQRLNISGQGAIVDDYRVRIGDFYLGSSGVVYRVWTEMNVDSTAISS